MSFNLRVIFTGLCAFVEHEDERRAKVLLIEGRNKVDPGDPDLIHCCPAIRLNRADLDPESTRQPDICRDGFSLKFHDSICFLDGEDFKIETVRPADAPAPPSLSFRNGNRNGEHPEPDENTRGDWSWVADLGRIKDGAGTPQEWWFAKTPTPDLSLSRPPILARFDLDRGELSTLELFRDRDDGNKPSVFNFASGYTQALASFVQCVIECEDDTAVQISSTLFGGQPGRVLTFAKRSNGQDLVVEISNAPFYDVMREFFPNVSEDDFDWTFPGHAFGSGFSFQHFYQLQRPFSLGTPQEVPGRVSLRRTPLDVVDPSSVALTRNLNLDKGFGCSPAKTGSFKFKGPSDA